MKGYIKIIIHLIFWFVYFSYSIQVSLQVAQALHLININLHLIINAIWALAAFYTFYFYVLKYFERNRYIKYLAVSFLVCLACAIVFLPFHFWISDANKFLTIKLAIGSTIGTFLIGQCGSLIRGFENWINNLKHQTEIENLYLRAENNLLKSQLNPHFLFNTLNNIDSFISSQPKKASEMLIALSEILRYMIYDTKDEFVDLSKEIEYINNYISLQRIRIKNPEALKVTLPNDCDNHVVVPLIFLPFIENAFKHVTFTNGKNDIEISISCSKSQITLCCINKYSPQGEVDQSKGGIGLDNVKRRLELFYKNKYNLSITKTEDTFKITLVLTLT